MPKRTHKTLRQSEDEIRDAIEDTRKAEQRKAAETLRRQARSRIRLTVDQIRVHLETDAAEFSGEDNDNLKDIDIRDSDDDDEDEGGVIEIKEVELPPALREMVSRYLPNVC